jgi:hypothetical protein
MPIIQYAIAHRQALFEAAIAAHAIATVVVNLTPTPKDDELLARLYRALEVLAGIITPMAKR